MTTLTYIEKYNFYLSTFLNELNVVFPEYKELITKNYGDILENNNSNTDVYVKEYMDIARNINSNIAKKDDSIFKGVEELNLLRDIDFRNLWAKDINDKTRENIWKYLQTLYVIGKKIVGDDNEIDNLIKDFTQGNDKNVEDLKNDTEDMMNMLKNMSTLEQDPNDNSETSDGDLTNLFEGGIISDIAKELTNELNLDNLDMGNPSNMNEAFSNLMGGGSGGGQGNFFNLVTKVGEKIQNKVQSGQINQGDLMQEAQKMMGGLKNPQQMANIMKNKHQQQGGSTRDRLRRKLEERQNKKNETN